MERAHWEAVLPRREHLPCPACLERGLSVSAIELKALHSESVLLGYTAWCESCGLFVRRTDSEGPIAVDELIAAFVERDIAAHAYLREAFEGSVPAPETRED